MKTRRVLIIILTLLSFIIAGCGNKEEKLLRERAVEYTRVLSQLSQGDKVSEEKLLQVLEPSPTAKEKAHRLIERWAKYKEVTLNVNEISLDKGGQEAFVGVILTFPTKDRTLVQKWVKVGDTWFLRKNIVGAEDGKLTIKEVQDLTYLYPYEINKEKVTLLGTKLSDVGIVVLAVRDVQKVGSGPATVSPDGEFIAVLFSVTNFQKDAITIDNSIFRIIDKDNREFVPSSNAELALLSEGKKPFVLKQINPGITSQGWVVFDIPPGLKEARLLVRGGATGKQGFLLLNVATIKNADD